MAFEYTSTKAQVSPQSPTINVAVDKSAGEAFKSLSNIIETTGKTYLDQVDAKAKAQASANYVDATNKINSISQLSEMQSIEVGNDMEAQSRITAKAVKDMDEVYNILDPDSKEKLVSFYNSRRAAATDTYNKKYKKARVSDFKDKFSTFLPSMVALSQHEDKGLFNRTFNQWSEFGVTSGMDDRREVEEFMVKQFDNYVANSLPEDVVTNHRWDSVRDVEAFRNRLYEANPKLKDKPSMKTFSENIDKVKNAIIADTEKNLKDSITTSNSEQFDKSLDELSINAGYNESDRILAVDKFNKTRLSNTQAKRQSVEANLEAKQGRVVSQAIVDKTTRDMNDAALEARIRDGFMTGKWDREEMIWQRDNNAKAFGKGYAGAHSVAVNSVFTAFRNGDPQGAAKAFFALQEMQLVGGLGTEEQRLAYSQAEVLFSGIIPEDKIAYAIDNRDKVEMQDKTTTIVSDMYEKYDEKTADQINALYSALKSFGVQDDKLAMETAESRFEAEKFSGSTAKYSPRAVKFLSEKHTVNPKAFKQFEKVLVEGGDFAPSLTQDIRDGLKEILDTGDAKVVLRRDGVSFEVRDDNGIVTHNLDLALPQKEMDAVMMKARDAMTEENKVKGVTKITRGISDYVYDRVANDYPVVAALLTPKGEALDVAGHNISVRLKRLGEFFSHFYGDTNTFIDDVLFQDMSIGDALAKFDKTTAARSKSVGEIIDYSGKNILMETGISTTESLMKMSVENPEPVLDVATKAIGSVMDKVVGAAEASAMQQPSFNQGIARMEGYLSVPKAGIDPKPVIGHGHNITEAEEKSGTIYGIPFRDEDGNNVEISPQQAMYILVKDREVHTEYARKAGWDAELASWGSSWDELDTPFQDALSSLALNIGGTKAGSTYSKVIGAAVDGAITEFAKELRRKHNGKNTRGMDNRVMQEMYYSGLINDVSVLKDVLPLANWKP